MQDFTFSGDHVQYDTIADHGQTQPLSQREELVKDNPNGKCQQEQVHLGENGYCIWRDSSQSFELQDPGQLEEDIDTPDSTDCFVIETFLQTLPLFKRKGRENADDKRGYPRQKHDRRHRIREVLSAPPLGPGFDNRIVSSDQHISKEGKAAGPRPVV